MAVSMALQSYFKILSGDFPDHHSIIIIYARIVEAKTKTLQKRRPYLKLDNRKRANVHVCIHWSVVQLQNLVPER